MNYWLFKCNPKRFRIQDRLRDSESITTWLVTRYKRDIEPGDIAFIWATGKNGGLTAVMRIVTAPQELAELPHERPYWVGSDETKPRIRVLGTFIKRFPPISAETLREIPNLSELCVFHGWQQATNFRVSPQQAETLFALPQFDA